MKNHILRAIALGLAFLLSTACIKSDTDPSQERTQGTSTSSGTGADKPADSSAENVSKGLEETPVRGTSPVLVPAQGNNQPIFTTGSQRKEEHPDTSPVIRTPPVSKAQLAIITALANNQTPTGQPTLKPDNPAEVTQPEGPQVPFRPKDPVADTEPPKEGRAIDKKPCRGSIKALMQNPDCVVPKWLSVAETEGETVHITKEGQVIWEKGTWILGAWHGDIWKSGTWKGGTFYSGIWESGTWLRGDWRGYIWKNGTWKAGEWQLGIWKGGTFEDGIFRRGIWRGGEWSGNNMSYSLWENGTWRSGGFTYSFWMDGTWHGSHTGFSSDYSVFTDSYWRYGIWYGGQWNSGIWVNGIWYGGEFGKGVWKNGIWKGGLWWGTNESFWECGIWEGGEWGWQSWIMNIHDRKNKPYCDLSLAGQEPDFLTKDHLYTFIPEEQKYHCPKCEAPEQKTHFIKPGCRGSIKKLASHAKCDIPEWLKNAQTLDETVAITKENLVVWEDGVWYNGLWKNGIWKHGVFANGIWEDGIWENGMWGDNIIQGYGAGGGMWITGVWKNGLFREGLWINGLWKHGYHVSGHWFGGIWDDGKWYKGVFYRGKKASDITGEWRWFNWLAGTENKTLSEAMEVLRVEYFDERPENDPEIGVKKLTDIKKRFYKILKAHKGLKKDQTKLKSKWTTRL